MAGFLLSTFARVLRVDLRPGRPAEVAPLLEGRGIYFGIAREGRRVWVAERNRDATGAPADPGAPQDAIRRWHLSRRGLVPDETATATGPHGTDGTDGTDGTATAEPRLADLHQIAWDGAGLWATTAETPFLLRRAGGGWSGIPVASALPPDLRAAPPGADTAPARARDPHHFNSIALAGPTVYVVAHNWGRQSFALALDRRAAETGRAIRLGVWREIGQLAHDILPAFGALWSLDSGRGSVVRLGPPHLALPIPTGTRPFPRGLAARGHHLYVAHGEYAEERSARAMGPARISRFDPIRLCFDAHWEIGPHGNTCVLVPL
ncbi:MAG: hypothetical protein ACFBSD_07990 [Paracoccaceae bacterium]